MGELIQKIKEPRKQKTLLVKNKLLAVTFPSQSTLCKSLDTKLTSQTQGSENVPPVLSRGV